MSQTATSGRENLIFRIASYIIIAAAALVGFNQDTSTTQRLVMSGLLLVIAVVLALVPKPGSLPWKYHLYLLVQGSLVAGLLLGVVFGSGVLLSFSKDRSLTKRDLILVLVFLSVCHSVIEDTVIFVALGVNAWFLIVFRFLLAVFATFLVACLLGRRHAPAP